IAPSTPGWARLSARFPVQCGMPNFFATSSVCCWFPPVKDTTCTSSIFCSASRCFTPKAPCPATTIFTSLAMFLTYESVLRMTRQPRVVPQRHLAAILLLVLENQTPQRRIRGGHVIEAIHLAHVALQSTARDQPHHELDSL